MRIAGLVLLFFFPRPVLNPTGVERWLGSGGRSSQVVVVDDSMSMGYAAGDTSAFQRARETAAAILAAARPQDRCTIATTTAPRAPVLHDVEGSRRDELTAAALGLPPTGTHAAWPAVLEGVGETVLSSCTCTRRGRSRSLPTCDEAGWDAAVSPDRSALPAGRTGGSRLRLVDVGAEQTGNVALQSLIPVDRTILAGAESRWEAVIRNDSPRVLAGVKAILRVDDKPTEVDAARHPTRQTIRVPLSRSSFRGAGAARPVAANARRRVAGRQSVLGRGSRQGFALDSVGRRRGPSTEPFGSEVDYLAAAAVDQSWARRRPGGSRSRGAGFLSPRPRGARTCGSWRTWPLRPPSRPHAHQPRSGPGWGLMIDSTGGQARRWALQ